MKKLFAFALVAVLAVGVLAACSGPVDDTQSSSSTTASTALTTVPTTAPTTAATTMPTLPGDTLNSTDASVAPSGKMPRMR